MSVYLGFGFCYLLDLWSGGDGTASINSFSWASFNDDDLDNEGVDG